MIAQPLSPALPECISSQVINKYIERAFLSIAVFTLFFELAELHSCAVFCLLQCGTEIHDTGLVMVDRTLTDICFEDTIIL